MIECPGSDALATIAEALDWNTGLALEHMRTCPDCNARLAIMTATHGAFEKAEVPEYVVARIGDAVAAEARAEAVRSEKRERQMRFVEAALAGACATVFALTAGASPANMAALAVTFAVGAAVPFISVADRIMHQRRG